MSRNMRPREKMWQQGYNHGRCVGLWDAVEVAQEHEERRSKGGVISENLRAEALHADKVKAADAADAIPDAPSFETLVSRVGDLPTTGLASAESPPPPSRAELIGLMRAAVHISFNDNCIHRESDLAEVLGDVLDALIKAGAVR